MSAPLCCLLMLLSLRLPSCLSAPAYDYETNDAAKWPSVFKQWCGDRFQSPIKLSLGESTYDTDMPMYDVAEDRWAGLKYAVFNDGHKITIGFAGTQPNVTVPGHPGSCFRPYSVHWHWGSDTNQGSEHWIEGRQYPMEGHIVMWNCQLYSSLDEAVNGFRGLAVLGTVYEPDSSVTSYSSSLSTLVGMLATDPRLQQCAECKNESYVPPMVPMDAFPIGDLLPADRSQYYLYSGSLTTPDCRENVMWTVHRQSIRVPPSVLTTLRSLRYPDGSPMVGNFRPAVPLNPANPFGARRMVVRSFKTDGAVPLPSSASWLRPSALSTAAAAAAAVALTAAKAR